MRDLRVNVVDLLREPGVVRAVNATVSADDIDVVDERVGGDIDVAVELESIDGGIAVDGTVSVAWAVPCRRCLAAASGIAVTEIDERYRTEPVEGDDAYLFEGTQLDLVPMVRETALLALADERVCRDECAGLCPVCGGDRNEVECECDTTVRDDRWAALDGLVLDD